MRAGLLPAAVAFILFAAGCGSEPRPGPRGAGGPARRAFTPMAGQESFFDGQILAEIHVGTEGMPEVPPAGGGGNREDGPRGGRRGGGRMSVTGGGGGISGNMAGDVPYGEGGRPARNVGGGPRPGALGGGRPVMIHLRFTNNTDAAVELRIRDFVSPLGNFAVRPEKLTIEAGQSLETEPMTSQLAGTLTEAPATLGLHLRGRAEKKTFPLQAKPTGAPAPGTGEK
jgi:hypothetical protein